MERIGERRYIIDYNRKEHEVICPEYAGVSGAAGGDVFIVIPWFLLPRKKYPIQAYVYAINLYSTNPEMGQRAVAEATRKKFGLSSFSHSTVCRSFKALEQSILKAMEGLPMQAVDFGGVGSGKQRRFPSVSDTAERRSSMSMFLKSLADSNDAEDIDRYSCTIVNNWYNKYSCLLI